MPASLVADTERVLADAGRVLVEEIERYLAARPRRSAHPLVSKPTEELVAEALAGPAAGAPAPVLASPPALLRFVPDWALPAFRRPQGPCRRLSVAEHLELTALVIEKYGWARGRLRTRRGARCIVGAQAVLYRLGYGDERTAVRAGEALQAVLAGRGLAMPYPAWNDAPDRTEGEVVYLLRQAASHARGDGR
ncbi:hypothetical protein [Streptomyces ehimensis]|uniref:Uncharacterized protein n=1 Tax=Streptomyces ehimensis TaxID=68195 RepID=A0ABV9BEX7_9ACTN